jgi:nicotinamidase-related amidase
MVADNAQDSVVVAELFLPVRVGHGVKRQAGYRRNHPQPMPRSKIGAALGRSTVHLCIDMQNLYAPGGPWATPWMPRVLPLVVTLAERFPERTVFTRFITPEKPEDMPGMWRNYYERWRTLTRRHLDPGLLELLPELKNLVPPATVIDKNRYSAFAAPNLLLHLRERRADSLVVTGSETDVCVLASVLGAVDLGFRVVVVTDAICSSSDAGHDALLTVYRGRYSEQIEAADTETVLSAWEG